MDKIKTELLQRIRDKREPITASYLALSLNISERTIKTYIKEINAIHDQIIFSTPKGYIFNESADLKDLQINNEKNRTHQIIIELIREPEKNRINHFADKFFISDSTVKNEISKIRKILQDFNISVMVKNNAILLEGSERNKRKVQTFILYEESKDNFYNIGDIQRFFNDQNIDVKEIKGLIHDVFNDQNIFINDYAITNLLLHVLVALTHVLKGIHAIPSEYKIDTSKTYFKLAKEISDKLDAKYHSKFDKNDTQDIALIIYSIGIGTDENGTDHNELHNIIDKDVNKLITKVLKNISDYYYIDFYDAEFFNRFSIHVNNLLKRLEHGRSNKNPLSASIKENCPLIYDSAVNASHEIAKYAGKVISEDEISFIAFHIGGELEKQKKTKENIKAVLYFPTYHNFSNTLYEKISTDNKDTLYIVDIVSSDKDLESLKYDLLISIHDVPVNYNGNYIKLSPFYTDTDQQNLKSLISKLLKQKRKDDIMSDFKKYIRPEFYYTNSKNTSQKEVLERMINPLIKNDYVQDDYYDQVMQREAMSSTTFGTLALPHTIKTNALKTNISIMLSDKPIEWNTGYVHIVILLAITKDERKLFVEIFDLIANLFTHPSFMSKMNSNLDYDSFMSIIENSLDEIL